MSELKRDLANVGQTLQQRLDQGLEILMRGKQDFAAFCNSGWLSGIEVPSLANQTQQLLKGLTTYIFTRALTENGWYAEGVFVLPEFPNFVAPINMWGEETPEYLQTGNCVPSAIEANSSCYYDGKIKWAIRKKDGVPSGQKHLISYAIQNHWTHMGMLFKWNIDCKRNGGMSQSDVFKLLSDGTIDFSCVSQLEPCVGGSFWGLPPCSTNPAIRSNAPECPVQECPHS